MQVKNPVAKAAHTKNSYLRERESERARERERERERERARERESERAREGEREIDWLLTSAAAIQRHQ